LQIAVIGRQMGGELGGGLTANDRDVPTVTGVNGTLMARRLGPGPLRTVLILLSARSGMCIFVYMIQATIQQAVDADLAAVAQLRREWTLEQDGEYTDPGYGERFAAWFARESSRRITWLAEVDGRFVGMMNLAVFERMPRPGRVPSRWGYLGNAFVLAAYRNQGIGGQLIHAVLSYADENSFARVVLSPSERSIPFYKRAGFGPANELLLWTPRKTTAR
jgi:GNAT superfamily N-acetyltransferase